MKGSNTLILNTATLLEALQEYFDKRLNPPVKVTDVVYTGSGYDSGFKVTVQESVQEPGAS